MAESPEQSEAQLEDQKRVAIHAKDLRIDYGRLTAVWDLTLEICAGEIFGLIGPNGAGKTSTMKVLATLLEPTYGEVSIWGVDAADDPRAVRRLVGYMPDYAPVYEELQVWEFLDLFAGAYGLRRDRRRVAVDEAIQQAGLTSKWHEPAGSLSRGMKQRLVLAKTLLPDPEVLLLDEPASGLDPQARIEMRKMLKQLAIKGKTIMISSHILTELEGLCTSIGIMDEGRLLESGPLAEVVARVRGPRTLVISVINEVRRARELLENRTSVHRVDLQDGDLVISFDGGDGDMAALLTLLVQAQIPVKAFYEKKLGVEDVFMKIGAREFP